MTRPSSLTAARLRPSHVSVITWVTASGVVLLVWVVLFRWFVLQGDDFRHLSVGNQPGGEFTAGQWWDALVVDYTLRNGRGADAAARLLLGPGGAVYPVLAPLVLTALSALSGWWMLEDRREARAASAWLVVGMTAPMVVFLLRPLVSGEPLFWGSGFANYALPLVLALAAALLLRTARDRRPGWWLGPAALVVLLAHVLHEQASFATLAMTAVLVGASGRRPPAVLALGAVSVAGFLVNLLAPGVWRRLDEPQGPALSLVEGAARGADAFAREGRPFLWLLVVCVTVLTVLLARREGAVPRRAYLLGVLTWGGFLALQVLSRTAAGDLVCGRPPAANGLLVPTLLLTAAAALGMGMFLWLLCLAPAVGIGAAALWAGSLASIAIPMATDRCAGRPLFLGVLLLGLVALVALRGAVDAGDPHPALTRLAPTAVALVGVGLVGVWTVTAWGGLRLNATEVRAFEAAADDATAGDVIGLPALSDERFAYSRGFLLPRYGCEIALYYDLPAQVVLLAPDGVTHEVVRPCRTGWDAWLVDAGHRAPSG